MKIENISTLKINQLTQEQYERLKAEDEIKDNELYFTPASPTGGGTDVTEYAYSKTETDSKLAEYAKTSDLDEYAKTTDVNSKQDKLSFDGTYDAVTNKVATEKTVTDKIAAVVANAPEDFDTLKEMSDWIASHKDSAAEMNSSIKANTDTIRDIQNAGYAKTSDIPSKVSQLENDTKYVNETQLNEAIAGVGGGSGDASGKLDANGWETGVDTPYLRYYDNRGNEIKLSLNGIYHCSTADNTDGKLSFPKKSGTIALLNDIPGSGSGGGKLYKHTINVEVYESDSKYATIVLKGYSSHPTPYDNIEDVLGQGITENTFILDNFDIDTFRSLICLDPDSCDNPDYIYYVQNLDYEKITHKSSPTPYNQIRVFYMYHDNISNLGIALLDSRNYDLSVNDRVTEV